MAQRLDVRLQRGARLDREPGQGAGRPQVLGQRDGVGRRLDVHRHVVRAGLGVPDGPPVRVVDHEVAVERHVGRRQQRLDHRQPEGQVRHEVRVHHVDVQPVGAVPTGVGDGRGLVGQPREVRRQDARGDHRMHVARVRRAGAAVRTPGGADRPAQRVRRSRARNIASVPCRCGHSCTDGPGPSRARPAAGPGVELLDRDLLLAGRRLAPATRRGRHHAHGLRQVRRARDVGDHAARAHVPQRGGEQLALQPRQLGHVLRPAPPPRLGPPPQGAQTGARGVDQHAVEGAVGQRRLAAVGDVHRDRQPVDGPAHELRAVLGGFDGVQRAALQGERARRAARTCRRARRTGRASGCPSSVDRHAGQRQRHELAALVLHHREPLADGVELPDVAAARFEVHAVGRVGRGLAAGDQGQLLGGDLAGPGEQVHRRAGVVGGERGVELLLRACAQGVGEGLGDPARVRVGERRVADRVLLRVGRELLHPGRLVVLADPAQHGVDEAGGAGARVHPDELDGRVDRGVRRHPGAQQLVGAQAQGVEQRRLDAVQRAVGAGVDHGVEQALGPQRAVAQLGGQRGVAVAQPVPPQDRRAGRGWRRRCARGRR